MQLPHLVLSAAVLSLGLRCHAATTIVINGTASHTIPSTLCRSKLSGDGGLYAELLQNRAFQQVTPGNASDSLNAWQPLNGASLAVIADPSPVSEALPNSLQVTLPSDSSGSPGFSNEGYWGIKVDSSWTYNASLYYRFPSESAFVGNLTVGLQTYGREVLASNSTEIRGTQTNWTYLFLTLDPTASAPTTNNTFFVTIDGASGAEDVVNFALFSLFPPTYNDRPNGMRIDIAETLAEMGPAFFRFPGGNNIQGQTTATRWQWNATVGPLLDRPGRVGDWGYANTDGLGLLEYLTFFEDVGMEPIMAVWAGYSLGGTSLPDDELAPYIQQAIDQASEGPLHFTAAAALRASLGHPEPFYLRFVEIGNEVWRPCRYPYRWHDFVGNLTVAFPQLNYIATAYPFNPVLTPIPLQYDVHVYQTPGWFAENSFYYDTFERNGTKYFEGEYASISTNASNLYGTPDEGRLRYPTMQSSTGEAAFMTGLERNSDIVFAASYAPLLQHVNSSQWSPDLISFEQVAGSVYRSTSYYVQQLFALNVGDEYLPSTLPAPNGTLFWTVSQNTTSGDVFIKISNTVATPSDVEFVLPFDNVASTATLQLLQGPQNSSNTPEIPYFTVPVTSTVDAGKTLNYTAPGYSVSVLTVHTS
ncbi:glycoside hydrolase family 51 protein [Amylocystis lapponica]|nr:glycoside hydrolase family 51 protein [Amylocystis lapponica]